MSSTENSTPQNPGPSRTGFALYATIFGGMALFAILVAVSLSLGGLPGTKDSPSATVKGQSIAGTTGAD